MNFFPAATLLAVAHYSDKLKLRWPFILANLGTWAVGFGINISDASAGVECFGTFLELRKLTKDHHGKYCGLQHSPLLSYQTPKLGLIELT